MTLDVAVLVPRRPDGAHRDRVWRWVADRWATEHPAWRVVEGFDSGDGPFNRARALNDAAERAGSWSVGMVADADSFVGADQATSAVRIAGALGQACFAFSRYRYLSKTMSLRVMAGFDGDWSPGAEFALQMSLSSMLAVPRWLWDEVGGADTRFVGWGGEDIALAFALETLGGGQHRLAGDVWHLWHPPAVKTAEDRWPQQVAEYAAARGNPDKMRAVLAGVRA